MLCDYLCGPLSLPGTATAGLQRMADVPCGENTFQTGLSAGIRRYPTGRPVDGEGANPEGSHFRNPSRSEDYAVAGDLLARSIPLRDYACHLVVPGKD